jgi:hypothetical protein
MRINKMTLPFFAITILRGFEETIVAPVAAVSVYKARKKEQRRSPSPFFDRGDGEHLLGWVEDGLKVTKKTAKSRA